MGQENNHAAGRNQVVDIARGIAMICIVLGHLGLKQVNSFVFTFHVPVFYLISGYYTKKKISGRQSAGNCVL